ncbi:MAG: hypothetical protein Q9213_001747 [Squamulea squamosa]
MQFKNIIAFISLAVMATAIPAENIVERTTKPTPGQTAQNKCNAKQSGTKVSCCTIGTPVTSPNPVFAVLNLFIGLTCSPIDVLSVVPLNQQCNQQVSLTLTKM